MAGQLIVHFKKDDTREVDLAQIFGDDVPESDRILKERVESYYDDLGRGSLSGYVVTRANENILIRPEAVFGMKKDAASLWFLFRLVSPALFIGLLSGLIIAALLFIGR